MTRTILLGLAGLLLSCHSDPHHQLGDPLPSFTMLAVDSSLLHSDQIKPGRWTVFVYFRPDCSHCQKETTDILSRAAQLADLNFIFLTPKPLSDLRQYAALFHLSGFPNIRAASDHRLEFRDLYHPGSVPYLVIYDPQKRLSCIYVGPVPVDSLILLNRVL